MTSLRSTLNAQRSTSLELIVVGGGISGLALAHFAAAEHGVSDVLVLEAEGRPGGKVQSEWVDGYCCEWGPQGFLDNAQDTLDLAAQVGLEGALVRADHAASDRFIVRGGRLRRVPLSPPAFLASGILSLPGRLRVLLEPFQGQGADEESVREFAARRIGREAADVLVDAMVTGVYAGDPARLSLPATFPRMREMERTYGSLMKAMVARARARRASGSAAPAGGPSGPAGTLTTFRTGMQQLTDTLADRLGDRLRLGAPVASIERAGEAFVVSAGHERLVARRVAVAVPPRAAAAMLETLLDTTALNALLEIPAVRVAVVMTGYRSAQPFPVPTRGFGFLVPGRERRRILGTIFNDSTFPHEAPAGTTLLRTLLGGARAGALLDRSDEELISIVRGELAALLGADVAPDMVHVIRHEYAIPQYTLGHLARLAAVDRAVTAHPGLVLLGNGLRGIALNSCVTDARRLAGTLVPIR